MGTAGYRFVPISGRVVAPPISYPDLDLGKPNAEGSVSGLLEATWTADTPVCVGEAIDGQSNAVAPQRIGGAYCLPGASLRGMVRAVTEIATFSHLGRINSPHHHGIRTYEYKNMPEHHQHRPQDLKAGWLTYHADAKQWTLTEATMAKTAPGGYWLLKFDHIVNRIGGITIDEWRAMSLPDKMQHLEDAGLTGQQTLYEAGPYIPNRPQGLHKVAFDADPGWNGTEKQMRRAPGYLVCAGDTEVPTDDLERAKVREAHFGRPDKDRRHPLPASVVELFHILHSDPGRNKRKRRGNWRWWLARMDYLSVFDIEREEEDPERAPEPVIRRGIPVFFHGTPPEMTDLSSQSPSEAARHSFFFSLSRVMRLPWPYSVGEIAQRLYQAPEDGVAAYVVPKLEDPNGWDFARALFGEVEEAMTEVRRKERPEVLPGESNRTNALAGRVAFAPAFAEGTPQPRPVDRKTGVLGTPRESFYPFYLRRDPRTGGVSGASYAHEYAVPAGRKRYVVRRQPSELPPGNDNERTQSSVDFLPKDTRFTGRVRFHNLHPVELGALLWALTFGAPGGPYRHLIGRAKAHGYGVLKAEVRFVRPPTVRNAAIDSDQAKQFGTYLELFKAHMEDALDRSESYEAWPEIETLRRLADPAVGKAAAAHGQLATGDLEQDYKEWKKAAPATEGYWPYGLPDI